MSLAPSGPAAVVKGLIPGGVGGVCCVVVGHPCDLVKVRMQTAQSIPVASASSPVQTVGLKTLPGSGTFGILRHTFCKEGVRGLYRGVSAPLLAVTPSFAFSFAGYEIGGFSAVPASIILAPSERIKCLMQVQASGAGNAGARRRGMIDCAMQVYSKGGVKSVYKGFGATLLRDVPGNAAYFGMYEYTRRQTSQLYGLDDPSRLSPLWTMFAGGLAGVANWIVAIPFDVVKSRYQTAPEGAYPRGLLDVGQTLVREEGVRAFYRGLAPALLRAFPANAACFLGVETARKLCS